MRSPEPWLRDLSQGPEVGEKLRPLFPASLTLALPAERPNPQIPPLVTCDALAAVRLLCIIRRIVGTTVPSR